MQFTTTIIAAVAALSPLAFAAPVEERAAPTYTVVNNCAFPVYVQTVQNSNGAKGPVHTLAHGGVYSQGYVSGGSNIRVGRTPQLTGPLSSGVNPTNPLFYDLSDSFGNPFSGFTNVLKPSIASCKTVSCAPNDEACYSNGQHIHENTCSPSTSLTLTVCSA